MLVISCNELCYIIDTEYSKVRKCKELLNIKYSVIQKSITNVCITSLSWTSILIFSVQFSISWYLLISENIYTDIDFTILPSLFDLKPHIAAAGLSIIDWYMLYILYYKKQY